MKPLLCLCYKYMPYLGQTKMLVVFFLYNCLLTALLWGFSRCLSPPAPTPPRKKKTALVAEYQVIIPLIGDCWGTRLPMRVINTPGHTCWICTFKFKTFHIKIKDFLWMIQKFWQFCWGIRYILSRNSFKINCLALLWKKLDRFKFCIYLGCLFDLFLILA